MLHIIERVINEKFQMGDHAQLVSDLLAKAEADILRILTDGLDHHIFVRSHIDTQVRPRNGEVGGDGGFRHRYHTVVQALAVLQEYIGQFLLEQGCYFLLSCRVHSYVFKGSLFDQVAENIAGDFPGDGPGGRRGRVLHHPAGCG